jgi:YVTN family beta-propeller protein
VTVIDGATNTTTTVKDPNSVVPFAVAVNPVTNKAYVANLYSNNITVINGKTNAFVTVKDPNAQYPNAVAINPVTDKIYVANGYVQRGNVTVIDGRTNKTTTITDPNANEPVALGLNPVTNKVYVVNRLSNNVTVIDGASNQATTVSVGNNPEAVAVDPVTNKIYVTGSPAMVIDGETNKTTSINVDAAFVAVDIATDKIYLSGYAITVLDGKSNTTKNIQCPNTSGTFALTVNMASNKIYLANHVSDNVCIVDGVSDSASAASDPNAFAQLLKRLIAGAHLSPTPFFKMLKTALSTSDRGTFGCSSHHSASPCMPFLVNSAFRNHCLSESSAREDECERMISAIPLVAAS